MYHNRVPEIIIEYGEKVRTKKRARATHSSTLYHRLILNECSGKKKET
jgi:hypothetical protein